MRRSNFTVKTKQAAAERAGGHCECCGLPLEAGNSPEYDHITPDALSGDNSIENCQVLGAKCCHVKKTHEIDRPMISKADRLRKKRLNQTAAKKKWPSRPFRNNWR